MIQPLAKPAPIRSSDHQARSLGTIYVDAVPIFIFEDVLEEIVNYSELDDSRELGGFLLGGLYEDDRLVPTQRRYIEIRHYLPAVDARSRAASLTFTHETWAQLNRQVEEEFPDDLVLGWHHTHPGFGVFLSGYDLFIHRHFFSEAWHVAMVVDPQRQELGFFQWRGGEVVLSGFVCVKEIEA